MWLEFNQNNRLCPQIKTNKQTNPTTVSCSAQSKSNAGGKTKPKTAGWTGKESTADHRFTTKKENTQKKIRNTAVVRCHVNEQFKFFEVSVRADLYEAFQVIRWQQTATTCRHGSAKLCVSATDYQHQIMPGPLASPQLWHICRLLCNPHHHPRSSFNAKT